MGDVVVGEVWDKCTSANMGWKMWEDMCGGLLSANNR